MPLKVLMPGFVQYDDGDYWQGGGYNVERGYCEVEIMLLNIWVLGFLLRLMSVHEFLAFVEAW